MVGIVVVDCGRRLDDLAAEAARVAADQIVLVVDAGAAAARSVAAAAEFIGVGAPPVLLAVNQLPRGSTWPAWSMRSPPRAG